MALPLLFPFPVNAVNVMDIGVGSEHIPRLFIQQNVDFCVRIALAKCLDHGRNQEHIAMMA
ncbi:hypothetical protein TUM17576_01870 [Enterobacter hormaechei]|nr:hypothetical protein TUM17576_01870 [Enterobacter hormaechei]